MDCALRYLWDQLTVAFTTRAREVNAMNRLFFSKCLLSIQQACTMRRSELRLGTAPLPSPPVQCRDSISPGPHLSFEVAVALVALIGFSLPALAAKEDSGLTITVLVYNKAQASTAILTSAEREAGRILGEAGLQPVWLDCLDRDPAADPQELCHKARELIDVVLRVLPGHIQGRLQNTLFGFVFPPALASVYYKYAGHLASSESEIPIMLGCAIAHEVGHLLLGPNSHSGRGIMHGEWGAKELRLALMGGLLFTSQQSKVIQAEARRRMSLQTGMFTSTENCCAVSLLCGAPPSRFQIATVAAQEAAP